MIIAASSIARVGFYAAAGASTLYIATSIAISVDEVYFGGSHVENLYALRDGSGQLLYIAYSVAEGGRAAALIPRGGGGPPPARVIQISNARYPESAKHIQDAQAQGKPAILTIDRSGRNQRRADALRNTPVVPGRDRDEYPPTVTAQDQASVQSTRLTIAVLVRH